MTPFLCGHYLRIGFDRLVFIDDGSSDGTYELLRKISARRREIVVHRVSQAAFRQSEIMTDAANESLAAGYNIAVPFDADEFWNVDSARIRTACCGSTSGVLHGKWVQFVQRRENRRPTKLGLFSLTYRAPSLREDPWQPGDSFRYPFVCVSTRKIAFKSDTEVRIPKGQHNLADGPSKRLARGLEVFHLPLRWASEIDRRAELARRVFAGAGPGKSWQSRLFRDSAAEGRLDDVWEANSASRDGFLDLGSRRIKLIPDKRLRTMLWRAWLYATAQLILPSRMTKRGSSQPIGNLLGKSGP